MGEHRGVWEKRLVGLLKTPRCSIAVTCVQEAKKERPHVVMERSHQDQALQHGAQGIPCGPGCRSVAPSPVVSSSFTELFSDTSDLCVRYSLSPEAP